jgi:hypothetical protein
MGMQDVKVSETLLYNNILLEEIKDSWKNNNYFVQEATFRGPKNNIT